MAKKKGTSWLDALNATGVEVRSARDALQVAGFLDTGNYALNWALSGKLLGGYPLGHAGEIFGDPGTGKSFLVSRVISMAQQAGGVALLDDTEGAHNVEHAVKLGIDVDQLAVKASRTVKEHMGVTQGFIKAYQAMAPDGPGVIACDSLAQLSTAHELEVGLDKRDMTKAAELKAFYRIVHGDLHMLPVLHLATNHTIAAIGNMFQSRTTPGGGGPKFLATFRLDLRAISKIKNGTEVVGTICRVVVDKNRIVAPWKETRLAIPFNKPISRTSGLVPLLTALGMLEERGSFLYHEGNKIGRAYKTKDRFLEQDETGERVLDTAPEILELTDAAIADGRTQHSVVEESVAADDDEEAEDE